MTEHGETYEPRHRATVTTDLMTRADGPSAPGVAVVVVAGLLASVTAAVVLVGAGVRS